MGVRKQGKLKDIRQILRCAAFSLHDGIYVDHYNQKYCPNNSSSQGQLFYATVTANMQQPPNYAVYPVDGCTGAEGVAGGTLSLNGQPGDQAIEQDMAGTASPFTAGKCVHLPQ